MSHDLYAAWATSEIANQFRQFPNYCYSTPPPANTLQIFASQESQRRWPISDGVVRIDNAAGENINIGIELKRENEGLHGVLTAIGQAHAYLHKGFSGSIIVIPNTYDSHADPGGHARAVIDATSPNLPIGVVTYSDPDPSNASPFANKLMFLRNIQLDLHRIQQATTVRSRTETQWGHVREGSSDPHAFFSYLQIAKSLSVSHASDPIVNLPQGLIDACGTGAEPLKYLSCSTSDSFHDIVWRNFWFNNIVHADALPIWRTGTNYEVNDAHSLILRPDGNYKMFFAGRSDSIKNKIVVKLNNGEINEDEAWQLYATNMRARAHSYREDIDSGLEALGLLDEDGKPSGLGYRFVDSCERTSNCNAGLAFSLLGAALLQNANFAAFLHYVYRLSERKFTADPLSFANQRPTGSYYFDNSSYLDWLADKLANELFVMRTVSLRGGARRRPFQAELRILRLFGFIKQFRIGVGLEINWPSIQKSMEISL